MGATDCFYEAFWKSVYTPQEALEKPSVAPMWFRKPVNSSHVALEKKFNTT
jgi:hypothetical protein